MMACGNLKQVDRFVGIHDLKKCEPRCLDHTDRIICHHFALELCAFTDRALRKIICCDARKKGAALRVVGLDLDRRRFKTGQIIQTSSREKLVSTLAASTLSREELPYRLRQQSLLGEFGR